MNRPHPHDNLPRATRAAAAMLRRCARRIGRIDVGALRDAASELMGAPVDFAPGPPEVGSAEGRVAPPERRAAAVLLESGAGGPENRVVVEMAPPLVTAVADRALGGEGRAATGQEVFEPDDLSLGVLGYVASRLLAGAGSEWRLRDVYRATGAESASCDEQEVRWPVDVAIGSLRETLLFRIAGAAVRTVRAPTGVTMAGAFRTMEVKLLANAGSVWSDASRVSSLRANDVIVLERCGLTRAGCDWSGSVDLKLRGAGRTVWRCAVEERGVRIVNIYRGEELPMTEGKRKAEASDERLMEIAGDAPVELTVELARFTLPLEEVGRLRPGEILETGRPVGERVTVRAGERAVASGELFDVEGRIGVRILSVAD